jgi:hypothetical protein
MRLGFHRYLSMDRRRIKTAGRAPALQAVDARSAPAIILDSSPQAQRVTAAPCRL